MKKILFLLMVIGAAYLPPARAENWDILQDSEKKVLDTILAHWETWMPALKTDGTAPLLSWEQLYEGLNDEQRAFLERVRAIDPKSSFNFQGDLLDTDREGLRMKRLDGQKITRGEKNEELPPQYLPWEVYEALEKMNGAMEKDLGKRLLVDSGYRSPAYQLYTYLFYMPKHGYSLVETGHWVALPGYSEHGSPAHQAIDFINQQGVNGEDRVEDFEELPEYAWLQAHAAEFGFELSYPRDKPGITFEPWHWRYVKTLAVPASAPGALQDAAVPAETGEPAPVPAA